jgi:4-amino-4-deoxy-L-arabinose transferase-like glycosyltransferase
MKSQITNHKSQITLFFILLTALFLRVYKLDELLQFYYDQGRDALVIHRLIHDHKLFLIGPVTGIEGIFLGPFFYYLITPFYLLGGGSPVFVTAVLGWLSVLGILILFILGREFFGWRTSLMGVIIYTFSYSLVTFSRWLANPNPLPLFSCLILLGLLKIYRGESKFWPWVGFLLGLSLQLEAAGAVFFLPATLAFIIWQRKKIKNRRLIMGALVVFLITLLPQIVFNFRHQGILFSAFKKFLLAERAFKFSFWSVLKLRLATYFDVFFSKLFYGYKLAGQIFLIIFTFSAFIFRRKFPQKAKILLIWLFSPLLGFLFYQGNFGYVWDYYFAGAWPVFILLVAFILANLSKNIAGKILLFTFFILFFWINLSLLKTYYRIGIGILLRDQLAAIDWVYQDAKTSDFNIDVYVPPVIPYAYDYLFKWYGARRYDKQPLEGQVSLLYTLYEVDSSHPERLETWLDRQAGIGKILEEERFGGITVQRRRRFE